MREYWLEFSLFADISRNEYVTILEEANGKNHQSTVR